MLSDQVIADFASDGAVKLDGVFTDWVEHLRKGIDRNMENPSWRERTYQPEDGTAPFFQDYCVWSHVPEYQDFVMQSSLGELASELTGSKTVQMFHDHVLVKEPGSSFPTPWHQDQPYYFVEAKQTISFWVPLDEIKRENCVQYVKASHKGDDLFRPQRFNGDALIENDTRKAVPDIANNPDQFSILGWDVNPGDAIAFDFRTLHGAPGNNAKTRRRAISFRLVGDEARICADPAQCSPAFPDLKLPVGEALVGEEFPVLYRAS